MPGESDNEALLEMRNHSPEDGKSEAENEEDNPSPDHQETQSSSESHFLMAIWQSSYEFVRDKKYIFQKMLDFIEK
jgi:hypothetical protein